MSSLRDSAFRRVEQTSERLLLHSLEMAAYNEQMLNMPAAQHLRLIKLGNKFEYWTMLWNLLALGVLSLATYLHPSTVLSAMTLVSFIHLFASIVVLSQLTGIDRNREHFALKVVALGYGAATLYLLARAIIGLLVGKHFDDNYIGIIWLGLTYFVMWSLSWNKRRIGHALQNQVLMHVSDMNRIDAYVALAAVSGLLLTTFCDLYWADPLATLIVVGYCCEGGIAAWKASVEHARLGQLEYEQSKREQDELHASKLGQID